MESAVPLSEEQWQNVVAITVFTSVVFTDQGLDFFGFHVDASQFQALHPSIYKRSGTEQPYVGIDHIRR